MADEAYIHCDVCGQDIPATEFKDHAEQEAKDRIREVESQLPN